MNHIEPPEWVGNTGASQAKLLGVISLPPSQLMGRHRGAGCKAHENPEPDPYLGDKDTKRVKRKASSILSTQALEADCPESLHWCIKGTSSDFPECPTDYSSVPPGSLSITTGAKTSWMMAEGERAASTCWLQRTQV